MLLLSVTVAPVEATLDERIVIALNLFTGETIIVLHHCALINSFREWV